MPAVRTDDRSPIPSDLLHYDAATRTLTAEASDLGHLAGVSFDHLDVRSARTGQVRRFRYLRTDRCPEGEVLAWRYRCADPRMTLVVLND